MKTTIRISDDTHTLLVKARAVFRRREAMERVGREADFDETIKRMAEEFLEDNKP